MRSGTCFLIDVRRFFEAGERLTEFVWLLLDGVSHANFTTE